MRKPVRSTALLLIGLLALALGGCTSLTGDTPLPPSLDRAEALAQRGDHSAAAREYEALASDNPGTAGNAYRLLAAREWLAGERPLEASRVLTQLAGPLAGAELLDQRLMEADIALATGEAARAWQILGSIAEPADAVAQQRYQSLRQRAAIASGRPVEGVRVALARERANPAAAAPIRQELLTQLRVASERGPALDPRAAGADAVVRGWLEAGSAAAQAARPGATAATALSTWRRRYPTHPAGEALRAAIEQRTVASAPARPAPQLAPGAHVAVLLPVTGRNAGAALQVREGLLAGLYAQPTAARPTLRVYDTGSRSVSEAIAEAQKAGAAFIIGPLTREEVVAAAAYEGRRPPLLALNFLPPESAPGTTAFYQFALSPEDEARLAARRALADGHRRGVALVPEGDWGTRVLAAFRAELEAAGGQLLSSASYAPGRNDYSAQVQSVLRVGESRARHKRIEGIVGSALSFQPRRRADIDFIFTPAPAAAARQLRPQLRFHYAGDIPAYATSEAFEPGAGNRDLEGLAFPAVPWLLQATEGPAGALRQQATQAWGEDTRSRGRLFAFGHDAWILQTALRASVTGPSTGIEGATGRLSIDPDGYIRRDLDWAEIKGGVPRLLSASGTRTP